MDLLFVLPASNAQRKLSHYLTPEVDKSMACAHEHRFLWNIAVAISN